MSPNEPVEPRKGVIPHLNFAGGWHEYPKHKWFVGTAWHYTSVEGCFGIVSHHELWASSATMLNDAGEMTYGVNRVREVASEWAPSPGSDGAASELLRAGVAELETTMNERAPFILSASTSPHLLNQWANYGESSGCAIGLDTLSILREAGNIARPTTQDALPLWLEVIYERDSQNAYIRGLLDQLVVPEGLVAKAIAHNYEPALLIAQNLAMLVAALKHPGFQAEQEVRLITVRRETTYIHYRATARGIIPFIKLYGTVSTPEGGYRFTTDPLNPLPLPIVDVRVGPPQGESEDRRSASIRDFMHAHGYSADVSGAGIPYLP